MSQSKASPLRLMYSQRSSSLTRLPDAPSSPGEFFLVDAYPQPAHDRRVQHAHMGGAAQKLRMLVRYYHSHALLGAARPAARPEMPPPTMATSASSVWAIRSSGTGGGGVSQDQPRLGDRLL
jgi:hypothetical protein